MRRVEMRVLALSIALVWCVGVGVPAMGQDAPAGEVTAERELEKEARRLTTAITEDWDELSGIGDQVQRSTGKDTQALRKRGREILTEFLADLDALSVNIMARQEAGMDVTEDRDQVAAVMRESADFLRASAVRYRDRGEELRAQMEEASAEDRDVLQEKITFTEEWYGTALEFLLGQTLAMEEFDLATDEERTFMTQHLGQWVDLVAGRVMLSREEADKAGRLATADPANTELATRLDAANGDLDELISRLDSIAGMMDSLGLDVSDYEQLIFEVTGEITTDLLNRDVLGGLAKTWGRSIKDWIAENGPSMVLKLLLFVAILVAFRILSKIARKVVHRALKASQLNVSQLLEQTVLSMTGNLVMIFGVLVALSQVGVEIAPLLAGLGVVGFIVGFALQDTLGNFASGVMILIYRPYDVEDLVEVAGVSGRVKDMSLVSTTILTLDNQTLVIPNSKIWGDVIKNITAQKIRRVDLVFGIGYSDNIPHAEKVMHEIVEGNDKVLKEPEPVIRLHNLGDSSVDFVVRPWVATDDYWEVFWDITREVKMRFDAEGISIPFPQRDVHVFPEGGGGES